MDKQVVDKLCNAQTMRVLTWRTDDLSLEECRQILGYGPTLWALELPRLLRTAASRQAGYWMANERELHAVYASLARHARGVGGAK